MRILYSQKYPHGREEYEFRWLYLMVRDRVCFLETGGEAEWYTSEFLGISMGRHRKKGLSLLMFFSGCCSVGT